MEIIKSLRADENKKYANVNNALDLSSGSRSFSSVNTKMLQALFQTWEIEYRFLDRLRIMFDRRTFSSSPKEFIKNQYKNLIIYQMEFIFKRREDMRWNETVQKYGIAYYQPIKFFFPLVVLLEDTIFHRNILFFAQQMKNQRFL